MRGRRTSKKFSWMFQLSVVEEVRWEKFSLRTNLAYQVVRREDVTKTCGRHLRSPEPRPPDTMRIGFRHGPGVKLGNIRLQVALSEAGADRAAVWAEVGPAAEEVLYHLTWAAAW